MLIGNSVKFHVHIMRGILCLFASVALRILSLCNVCSFILHISIYRGIYLAYYIYSFILRLDNHFLIPFFNLLALFNLLCSAPSMNVRKYDKKSIPSLSFIYIYKVLFN